MDQVADAEPQAKKQKQAPVGSAVAGTPADHSAPIVSTADRNGKTSKKRRKSVDGDMQTSVKCVHPELFLVQES